MENAEPIKDGLFPKLYEEGATGKLDNKGAIFIPGGLIYKDVDKMPRKDIIFGSIKSEEIQFWYDV